MRHASTLKSLASAAAIGVLACAAARAESRFELKIEETGSRDITLAVVHHDDSNATATLSYAAVIVRTDDSRARIDDIETTLPPRRGHNPRIGESRTDGDGQQVQLLFATEEDAPGVTLGKDEVLARFKVEKLKDPFKIELVVDQSNGGLRTWDGQTLTSEKKLTLDKLEIDPSKL